MAMLPLLFVLSLETFCLCTVLAVMFELREERKGLWSPKKGRASLIGQIVLSLGLGFVVMPAVVSALGVVAAFNLDGYHGVSEWCLRLGGAWAHDQFPESAPWSDFVWDALAISLEMFLFALLAARVRRAMLTHQSMSDTSLSQSLMGAKMGAFKRSLAFATSIVLATEWWVVTVEVLRRLRA